MKADGALHDASAVKSQNFQQRCQRDAIVTTCARLPCICSTRCLHTVEQSYGEKAALLLVSCYGLRRAYLLSAEVSVTASAEVTVA